SQRTNQRSRAMPTPTTRPPRGATLPPTTAPSATRSAAIPATIIRERRRLLWMASHMGLLELHLRGLPLLLVGDLEQRLRLEAEVSGDEVRREGLGLRVVGHGRVVVCLAGE